LFDKIIASTPAYGIGQASAKEIDDLNILQASFLAMQRAYDDMVQKGFQPTHILVDGNRLPPKTPVPAQAIIGGDAKSLSISAASILAKVTRDRIMTDLAKQYPAYGWDKNAGYGTKIHQQALQQFGITPHHRLSYKPIQKLIKSK
jgi:ribonuclease HII